MPGGRPPLGLKLVERTAGTRDAKTRLRTLIETLTGERSVSSACEILKINEAAFHKLRDRFLQESVEGLEKRKPGVKPKYSPEAKEELEAKERQIKKLEHDLARSRVRTEIALATTEATREHEKKGFDGGR